MRRRSRSARARAPAGRSSRRRRPRRGAALAALGAAGYWAAWALPAMLVADVVLLAGVWLDGRWAPGAGAPGLEILRDAPSALSVGRGGQVTYRWANRTGRRARLRVREVRPELLGGGQPPPALPVPPPGERRGALAVIPVRRGRSEEHTSELQSLAYLVCRLLLEKKKNTNNRKQHTTPHETQP